MKLSSLMIIKAIVCLVFGSLLLLLPTTLLSLYGVTAGPAGILMARLYAAVLFGNLMVTWFARNAGETVTRRAIVLDLFVYDAIGFVVALLTQLSGVTNVLGWSVIVIYLFFTLAFGYFQFMKLGAY